MGIDYEVMFQKVRGGQFDRSPVLQDLLRERAWDFTKQEVVEAAHRYKAWQALRSRMNPDSVRAARERREPWALAYDEYVDLLRQIGQLPRFRRRIEDVEDAITFLYELTRDLGDVAPVRSSAVSRRGYATWQPSAWDFAGYAEQIRRDLAGELFPALIRVLGKLTADFLQQLRETGKFEVPPILPAPVEVTLRTVGERDPTAGLAGFGLPGLEVLETGDVIVLTVNPGGAGSASVVSPALYGPSVIERMFFAQDGNITGTFQVNIQKGGVVVPGAAVPEGIFGDPLFVGVRPSGAVGSQVDVASFTSFGEWWPRRLVPYTGYRVVFTVSNTSGVPGFAAISLDRRDVVRRAS